MNKVWMTMHTVGLAVYFFLYLNWRKCPVFECESPTAHMFTFLLQVFVVLLVKMVEHVLRRMFALVRLAGQESDAKQVSHIVYIVVYCIVL